MIEMQIAQAPRASMGLHGQSCGSGVHILRALPEVARKQIALADPADDAVRRTNLHLVAITTDHAEGIPKVGGRDGGTNLGASAPNRNLTICRVRHFEGRLGPMKMKIDGNRNPCDNQKTDQNLPHQSPPNSSRE